MTRRILLAEIMHESNTFNRIATTKADFATRYWLEGDEIPRELKDTNTEIWGFLEAGRQYGWDITHPFAASASPSGPMAVADWETVKSKICAPLVEGAEFDAIILVLHGAMTTQTADDADGELLETVRAAAGPDVLLAATLDMHANVSERMVHNTDLFMTYRTYPHIDQFERAQHLARIVECCLAENIKPKTILARRPQMDAADHGRTSPPGPMNALLERVEKIETDPRFLCANLQTGFPWSDVDHQGPSVIVSGLEEAASAETAEELADLLWESRHETQLNFASPADAIEKARAGGSGDKPLILADFADNPAGGAYGDSPNLLRAMLEAGLENASFATISDPLSVQRAVSFGEGETIKLTIGGKGAPEITPPLEVTGKILLLSDGAFICEGPMWQGVKFSMGPTAVLQVDGIEVILSSVPTAVMDLQVFRSVGIEPSEKTTIALKSRNHFRAAYEPLARECILVDAGGIASMRLAELPYQNLPRPIWPLDLD